MKSIIKYIFNHWDTTQALKTVNMVCKCKHGKMSKSTVRKKKSCGGVYMVQFMLKYTCTHMSPMPGKNWTGSRCIGKMRIVVSFGVNRLEGQGWFCFRTLYPCVLIDGLRVYVPYIICWNFRGWAQGEEGTMAIQRSQPAQRWHFPEHGIQDKSG